MLKTKLFHIVEKGHHGNRLNQVFDYFIMSLIVLSVFSIILDSISGIREDYGSLLNAFNVFSIVVFTAEYMIRIYISDLTYPSKNNITSRLTFIFSGYGLIDLLAILPFYIPIFIALDFRFLRILRLFRFVRILKINRYNNSLNLIWTVIKEKKSELIVTGFVTFIVLFMSSFIMYYIEGDVQPDQFPNILAAFWWAIATLTTVGYGDVYPVTSIGKILSSIIAILGIGIIALPTGIISAGLIGKIDKTSKPESKICPHCKREING